MYTKRRDKILIIAVLIYLAGPTFIQWAESLNNIDVYFSRIDFSGSYSGQERILYEIKEEISDVRTDIRNEGYRTFWLA